MSNQINYAQLTNYIEDITTKTTSFTSEVLQQLSIAQSNLAMSLNQISDALEADIRHNSDLAYTYYAKAADAGDDWTANFFKQAGDHYKELADSRLDYVGDNWVKSITANINSNTLEYAGKIGLAGDVYQVGSGLNQAVNSGDTTQLSNAIGGIIGAEIGVLGAVLVTTIFFASSPALAVGVVIGIAALIGGEIGESLLGDTISDTVTSHFNSATIAKRTDPLTLDLDGDGIETVGTSANIMFDVDADGVKTVTGWIKTDDGLLVRDLNGNGVIDNGSELFGDSTIMSNGETAKDGFDALSELDSNHDGKISNLDTQFSGLRIWRDLNQDGISQSNELFSLLSQNIASVNLANKTQLVTESNGNQLANIGTFTRIDGTTGLAGEMGDVNLASDTFHSQFTDHITITAQALTLPDMHGSGMVRDLREAASMSSTLEALLVQFKEADSRDTQLSLIDSIVKAWSDTSSMKGTFTGAYNEILVNTNFQFNATHPPFEVGSQQYNDWVEKMTILERFNGRLYSNITELSNSVTVNYWVSSQDLLNMSYNALKESVIKNLIYQVRLSPLVDMIQLNIDSKGVNLEFSLLNAEFNNRFTLNQNEGLLDLLDFNMATKDILKDTGWSGWELFNDKLSTVIPSQSLLNAMKLDGVYSNLYSLTTNGTLKGSIYDDVLLSDISNNGLMSGAGNDILLGGAGNDSMMGESGNDILYGQTGNDTLHGGSGSDTYIYKIGDGQDIINTSSDSKVIDVDTLKLIGGISPADIIFTQNNSSDLILGFANSTDKITINGYFNNINNPLSATPVSKITFENGTEWSVNDVINILFKGTLNNDKIFGTLLNDVIYGNDGVDAIKGNNGNDILYGQNGNDILDGGDGNDVLVGDLGDDNLYGFSGNDILLGGFGNDNLNDSVGSNLLFGDTGQDSLSGNSGNEIFIGGIGNDTINTGTGTDVILFNKGDGYDLIKSSVGTDNTLSIGGLVDYNELSLSKIFNTLTLNIGSNDKLNFEYWFNSTSTNNVNNLQIMVESMNDYDSNGADALRNNKVELFNFVDIVNQFIAEGAPNNWAFTDEMLNQHILSGSDSNAIGGDVAYEYATNKSFNNVGLIGIQSILSNSQLGVSSQSTTPTMPHDSVFI